jgi:hypothetical protein
MGEIARFILFIGPCSSVFDYTTYLTMWFIFKCSDLSLVPPPALAEHFARASVSNPDSTYAAALFQTGWFVESLLTQTLIIHVIRTNKVPFIQSRASWPLIMTSGDHVGGHVVAIFANRIVAGVCSSPNPLLAAIIGDAAAVRRAHPGGEDVVGSQAMDLMLVAGRSRLLAAQLRYRARVCAERRSPFTMKAPP